MSPNLHTSRTYLADLTRFRLATYFGQQAPPPATPNLQDDDTPFARFVLHRRLTVDEYTALVTGLISHLQPAFFDNLIAEFLPQGGDFPAIGGVKGTNYRGFLPTGETLLFLLAGDDFDRRLQVQQMFGTHHFFAKEKILYLEESKPGEPVTGGRLILDPEYVELFTLGYITPPRTGGSFPAQRIDAELSWEDLVLNSETRRQLEEIKIWLEHNDTLLYDWGMQNRLKPGFRALFYGPPGTGKTMAATLLGKRTGHEVYRIDLSMIVSKYIGETEKNLAALFEKAAHKNWILFFDEADALFGKRTSVKDAHDRFANQEVSYLLQKIEDFPGLSILASNFKSNMDEAFTRRFQTIVYFPMPKADERLRLWENNLPSAVQLDPNVHLRAIAERYELSGSNIVNVVHYCCLQALANQTRTITNEQLVRGIQRELLKENKTV